MSRNPLCHNLPARLFCLLSTGLLLLPLMFIPARHLIFLSQSAEIRRLQPQSEKLEKLVFTPQTFARLEFERDRREFQFQGEMYDVHSITTENDQVIVLALKDTRESGLLRIFQDHQNSNNPARPQLKEIGFMPYFRISGFSPDFARPPDHPVYYTNIRLIWSDPCLRICSPPPEIV